VRQVATPLQRSFEDYKKNEKKEVKVDEILGADVARKAVSDAMVSA
jgi:inorganic pyrophosphatase